jgi:hypothetical protein
MLVDRLVESRMEKLTWDQMDRSYYVTIGVILMITSAIGRLDDDISKRNELHFQEPGLTAEQTIRYLNSLMLYITIDTSERTVAHTDYNKSIFKPK